MNLHPWHPLFVWLFLGLAIPGQVLEPLREESPEFVITHLGMQDGLPSERVRDVLQTRDGYLWAATFNGLARFDGVRFRVFDDANTPPLRNSLVNCLLEDSSGRLWIGNDTGEVTWRDQGGFHALAVAGEWASAPIIRFAEAPDGMVLVLNRDGRLLMIENTLTTRVLNEGRGAQYSDLFTDREGTVWLVRYGGALVQLRDGEVVSPPDVPPSTGVYRDVSPAREGGLWIRDGLWLRRWKNGQWAEYRGRHPWGVHQAIRLYESEDGRVWAGTMSEGLFVIGADGSETRFGVDEGMGGNIAAAHEDHEHNVWVATMGAGLARLRTRVVSSVTPEDLWHGRSVDAVTPAFDGGLWIGTSGAGLYHYDGKRFRRHADAPGQGRNQVRTLLEDERGRLWVGTQGAGLRRWDGGAFGTTDAPPRDLVYAAFAASDGALWFGTQHGALRLADDTWSVVGTDLHRADVRCIAQTTDGAVWLGMRGGGVARVEGETVTQFLKADGLPYDYVSSLLADEDGGLWIGTAGGGLARWEDGTFSVVGARDGLPSDFIGCIQSDDAGSLWLSSYAGIVRLAKSDLLHFFRGQIDNINFLVLDSGDGLTSLEMAAGSQPTGCRTADGRLWFASSGGLMVVDPTWIRVNELPPPVVIEDILINGRVAEEAAGSRNGRRTIPAGSGQLEFRYTALSLPAPNRVLFKYRLEGLDDDWVDANNRRSAYYSHLPPGDYTFRVIACNNFGYWNEAGAELPFRVLPFFWQKWWFAPACWLGGLSLVGFWGISVLRGRHRHRLETVQREQLVERERTRIARDLHDDLGTGLTEIDTTSTLGADATVTPEESREYFQEIGLRANEMVVALDEIVWAVNPRNDNLGSLASYFSQFAEHFIGSTSITCRFDVPDSLPPLPLTADQRHSLFLAFKEALNNVVKHSGATQLRLSIGVEADVLQVAVEDNGQWSDPDRAQEGADGLQNMRVRLARLKGRCEIRPREPQGTRVAFYVPVK